MNTVPIMTEELTQALQQLQQHEALSGAVLLQEPLSQYTTYRIGGPCLALVKVSSEHALQVTLQFCQDAGLDWCVIGKGSNLLVSDEGYNGIVMVLKDSLASCDFNAADTTVQVGAGSSLPYVVKEACRRGYAGLEFAAGTPGSIGGALVMNAGSRDDWIGSRVLWVKTINAQGAIKRYEGQNIIWGYRSSSFAQDEIIVDALLQLTESSSDIIEQTMSSFMALRKQNQPLNYPSCGSVFKNPKGHSAGALIESVGLKGVTQGGAQISEKHANFIVNKNHASAADVRALIGLAQDKVKERYGIELQPEVRFLGF